MGKIRKIESPAPVTNLNPADYPLGSAESRAAARAAILPEPCFNLVYGRDMDDKMRFARIEDGSIHERRPDETFPQFTSRMINLPGRARGGLLTSYTIDRPRHQESESIPHRRKSDYLLPK